MTQSILVKVNSRTSVYIEIDSSKNFRGPTIIFKSAYQKKTNQYHQWACYYIKGVQQNESYKLYLFSKLQKVTIVK